LDQVKVAEQAFTQGFLVSVEASKKEEEESAEITQPEVENKEESKVESS